MALLQSRYEIRVGQPARIEAPAETLDFLLHAKTRRVSVDGMEANGLVVGPNYAQDQILLAPSLRAKPGEYTVTLSATSETGEERQTTLHVVVEAQVTVPSNSTRPPVVLLNGWITGTTNACNPAASSADTFGNLEKYLTQLDGVPQVYLFDNCAVEQGATIEALGADLGVFLNSIKYDTGAQVPQIDLVAHSMGGLIARAYLAGIQPNETFQPPAPTLVRKLVLIATPNFGSFVAGNYASSIVTTSQSAELVPGSALLWNLATWNQYYDDLRGVDAIAIAGNAGSYIPNLSSSVQNNSASDGLVTLTSASLGFAYPRSSFPTRTRIVPYCHVDPTAYTNTLWGNYLCNAPGIANVTDTNQATGQIVRSFLAGTTAWSTIGTAAASDPYLSKYGGMFFGLVNGSGSYVKDMSTVQWGTVPLNNGGDANTIFYIDLAAGTGTLTATSQSLGTVSFNSVGLALGYTSAVRGKIGATIYNVTPLASSSPQVLAAGTTVTINGANFGSQCSGCQVQATPQGASSAQILTITSWKSGAISVKLPANLTGLLTLTVLAATAYGSDSIGIMVVAPTTIAVTPASLEFTYTAGGTVPAAQLIQITNSGTGTAALSWTATWSDSSWLSVSPASGTAPSAPSVSVSPAALSAGTYNGTIQISAVGASNTPVSVAVTLTVAPAVTVTAVVNAGSYQPGIASGGWISIFGTNLSQSTYGWQVSDFVNGALPTALQGVSVTVNGLPAYVDYISPTQINALAPDDATLGSVPVQVTTAGQISNVVTVQKSLFAPAFLTFDGTHVAALHADYSLVGAPNLLPGAVTTPAKPGETILLYGVGFGPTTPPQPTGQLVTAATPLANAVQIAIGGQPASVPIFAGLAQGAGLYQFNVTVPNGLPDGDATVVATMGGVSTQTGVAVTVQR
jgi:uncharacterized protein (TIGR03437 family)